MPELAVIIPTLNEIENIDPIVARLDAVLKGVDWEVVFVDDDSQDGTAEHVRELGAKRPDVRVLHRIGRSGLASACIEGMLATSAPYLAVMDADLQHDESLLPEMLALVKRENLDIVVGSRNVGTGSMGEFAAHRQALSRLGARFSTLVCRCELTDPMSGFFLLRRQFFESVVRRLSGIGFKILVDLLASAQAPVRLRELPYRFRNRERGESKLDFNTALEYFLLLADKLFGEVIPARFLAFALVGSFGVVIYLSILGLLYRRAGMPFIEAQGVATVFAMTMNFLLNNMLTFRDLRLRGWNVLKGLATFYLACTVGSVANIALADFCMNRGLPWYLAAVIGLMVGSVWNFGVTSVITWRRLRRRARRAAATLALPEAERA